MPKHRRRRVARKRRDAVVANAGDYRPADLHMHSRASDGAYSPTHLMELAAARGLSAVSLTDHDTVAGIAEAASAAGRLGLDFLPGIELDADHRRGTMHILGYGIDVSSSRLTKHIEIARNARNERNQQILDRLRALNIAITPASIAGGRELCDIGRSHIAAAMVREGFVRDFRAAFRDYLGDGAPAFVRIEKPRPEAVISIIRDAGGVAVLAHPFTLGCESAPELETTVTRLIWAGLAGIETRHPSHTPPRIHQLEGLARRHSLLETGGSDVHIVHPHERRGLGFGISIDAAIVSMIRERCAPRIAV